MTWLDQHGAGIAAVAASIAAIASIVLLYFSQRQIGEALEARFDQHRPLVIPIGSPLFHTVNGVTHLDTEKDDHIATLKNIGAGPALNIRGVVFGPQSNDVQGIATRRRYLKLGTPLDKGSSDTAPTHPGGFAYIRGETKIGGHSLYAPEAHAASTNIGVYAPRVIARYPLTYEDVFHRKHASVFDYSLEDEWVCVAFIPRIPKDIEELDGDARKESSIAKPWQPGE